MSEASLPHLIDPGKWADRLASVETRLPLSRFGRLVEGALGTDGDVAVSCRFSRDARHLPRLQGTLATTLKLTCQRCLAPVDMSVSAEVDVWLLDDEARAERLADEEDYVVCEDGQIDLPALLEDELILAMPLVARHEDCDTLVPLAAPEMEPEAPAKKENPFQMLAGFKPSRTE